MGHATITTFGFICFWVDHLLFSLLLSIFSILLCFLAMCIKTLTLTLSPSHHAWSCEVISLKTPSYLSLSITMCPINTFLYLRSYPNHLHLYHHLTPKLKPKPTSPSPLHLCRASPCWTHLTILSPWPHPSYLPLPNLRPSPNPSHPIPLS